MTQKNRAERGKLRSKIMDIYCKACACYGEEQEDKTACDKHLESCNVANETADKILALLPGKIEDLIKDGVCLVCGKETKQH